MKRQPRRRATRSRARKNGFHPVAAFLLIACFGILFAGCSRVEGPQTQVEDTTFTAEDVETFDRLDGEVADTTTTETATGTVAVTSKGTSSAARLDIAATPSGSGAAKPVDPELRKKYDAIRQPSGASDSNVYRVTNEFVNVRSAPSSGAGTVARLNLGDRMTLAEFVNASWAKVTMQDGKQGYVSTRYIGRATTDTRLPQEEKNFENLFFVDYAFVNIRKEQNVASEKIGEIPGQALVRPLSLTADWAKVSFEGKEGFVSRTFLKPFRPTFLVRQENFTLPVLRYDITEPAMIESLVAHAGKLRENGAQLTTMRAVQELLLTQEIRDVRLNPKSVVIGVTGITPENVRRLSDALYGAGIPATFFIETRHLGISGISQKLLSTLKANGFDLQSGGHTGDDLRGLTNAQVTLELNQSRQLLEDMSNQAVFAVAYPQGGVNDRVTEAAAAAGYLFGVASVPDKTFSRDQLLRMPGYVITASMTTDDVLQLVK